MLFMIIERFRDDDMIPVYERVRDLSRCFQLSATIFGFCRSGFCRGVERGERFEIFPR